MKALFINGSPRKNGNTAQLLKRAMDGAREAGAEVELVNLYDRSMNYKGCMSCFACKLKGGKKGVCSFKDDLQPILQKAVEADVLVCGSPNYCGYPSAALRAFMERMEFPAVNYSDYSKPVVLKRICSATIYTMNCPNEEVYRQMNYPILMDTSAKQLAVFGPTEILCSYAAMTLISSRTTTATMPPRSARLTRPRYAKRNSPSTSKKPTNWASDWWQRPRNNKLKQRRNNHVQFEL